MGRSTHTNRCGEKEFSQMETTRSATATWQGDLLSGSGHVSAATTGLFTELPVSWASRTEEPAGRTSPEELLAAAHSACFSMSLSSGLAKAGYTAEQLDVRSDVTFQKQDDGWRVVRSHLTVSARVPGIDEETFRQQADAAKDGCPISRALTGNVALSVDASLSA
jgi:lipoyl-dependent peroxiredoxin